MNPITIRSKLRIQKSINVFSGACCESCAKGLECKIKTNNTNKERIPYNIEILSLFTKRKISPLNWNGGKSLLAQKIYENIPEHSVFVDIFAGSGTMSFINPFFNTNPQTLQPQLKKIIMNDASPMLFSFYKAMKESETDLFNLFKEFKGNKDEFKRINQDYKKGLPNNLIGLAKFLFLKNTSLYGGMGAFRPIENWDKYLNTMELRFRLCHQILNDFDADIYNTNAFELIDNIKKQYSGNPNVFLYADPPHVGTRTKDYGNSEKWEEKHLAELILKLKDSGFKFAISEFDTQSSIFEKNGLKVTIIKTRKNIANTATEIIATNY